LIAFLSGDVNMDSFGYYSIFGRMDEFIIGMVGAYFFTTKKNFLKKSPKTYLALSTIMIVILLFVINRVRHHFGYMEFENFYVILPTIEGLAAAGFIVSYVNIFQNKSKHFLSKIFTKLGELSYSIYLTHFMLIALIASKLSLPDLFGNWWWSALFYGFVIVLPLALGLSFMTYNFIEKPFLQLRKKYVIDKKIETAQQAV
jgi:peptidoglycan/LPS O-acetylase OafA/YrhL